MENGRDAEAKLCTERANIAKWELWPPWEISPEKKQIVIEEAKKRITNYKQASARWVMLIKEVKEIRKTVPSTEELDKVVSTYV